MALTAKQRRMKRAVESLQKYIATYTDQPYYMDYRVDTFIDDTLYGLGVALDRKKHEGASGYRAWRIALRKHLDMLDKLDRRAEVAARDGRGKA